MNNIYRFILIKLFLVSMFFGSSSFALFGKACFEPPESIISQGNLRYIKQDTLVGYLNGMIDISECSPDWRLNSFNGCTVNSSNSLRVCIKKDSSKSEASPTKDNSDNVVLQEGKYYRLSSISSNPIFMKNISFRNVRLIARKVGESRMCLFVDTIYGMKPIMCRAADSTTPTSESNTPSNSNFCQVQSSACKPKGVNNTLFTLGVSGKLMQCVYETMDRVFFDPSTCGVGTDMKKVLEQETDMLVRPFGQIQQTIRQGVLALIVIFIFVTASQYIIEPEKVKMVDILFICLKIIMVIYFAVGIVTINRFTSAKSHDNGMTQIVLPLVLSISTELTNYVSERISSAFGEAGNLCKFDKGYPVGKEYYGIFDKLDCSLGTYIGTNKIMGNDISSLQLISNKVQDSYKTEKPATTSADKRPRLIQEGVTVPIVIVMIYILFSGGIIQLLCLMGLLFMTLSLVSRIVLSIILTIILVYILAYISPFFIPLSLFDKTKGKFDKWLSLFLSTSIQPILLICFGGLLLSLFNQLLFDGCNFLIYQDFDTKHRLFELAIPSMSEDKCKSSAGYLLYRTIHINGDWNFLSGMFIDVLGYVKIDGSLQPFMKIGILIYIFSFFVDKINQFATGISNGLDVSGFVADPSTMIKKAVKGAAAKPAARIQKSASKNEKKAANMAGEGKSKALEAAKKLKDKE